MKNVFLLFICILSCSFLSCQDDTDDRGLQINENDFQLSYTIPRLAAITRSEVTVEEGEDQINTFYALFFENTTEGVGQFLGAIDLMEDQQNSISGSGLLKINYSAIPGLSPSGSYKMLLCANLEAYHPTIAAVSDLETICQGMTETQVNSLLQAETQEAMTISNLPMSASLVKKSGQTQLSATLTRAVSRFDVVNHADDYKLVSASLWNVYPSTLLWENGEEDFSGSRTERYYSVDATEGQIIGGLYGFENFVENPEMGDVLTTALIVEMENLATGSTEFFRINIHPENKPQELKRNNVYCSTIQEVFGSGFSSEKEAYENDLGLLAVNINGWVGVSNGSLVYDDKNTLAMPTSVINLAMAGDTRTYNIFTDGEGKLEFEEEGIPEGVTVSLQEGNQVKIVARESSVEWSGLLTFTLGNVSASMRVEQREYIANYLSLNFDVTELPVLGYEKGAVSDDIEVTSSGAWKAQIYNNDSYFSFSASSTKTTFDGKPGTSLTIYTRSENKTTSNRKGFVIFTLIDDPEITRVMVLEQEKYEEYLYFTKDNKVISQTGGTYTGVTLHSNAEWEITSIDAIMGGSMTITFKDDNGQTVTNLKGSGTKQLIMTVTENTDGNIHLFHITAKSKGGKQDAVTLYQRNSSGGGVTDPKPEPDPEPTDREMWFVTYGTGRGNLANPSSDSYKQWVYSLGQNMRNSSKYGNGGSQANIGKDAFQYTTSLNSTNIKNAKVIQLLNNPTSAYFDKIYSAMQEDPTMFLMITSQDAAVVNSILKEFEARANAGYGSAVQVPNPPSQYRPFHTATGHKLKTYLLDGDGGKTGAPNLALQGATNITAGLPLPACPPTFVPIIMANSNNNYCVFGIDPTNRLIFMGEPGLFGPASAYSAYPSSNNFKTYNTGNLVFLDNLTAWIMHATGTKGFLQKYQ